MSRLVLYALALVLFVVALSLDKTGVQGAERVNDLWYFALFVICAEFVYRLRDSWLMFLPLYKGFYFIYQFLEIEGGRFLTYTDGFVHIAAGICFVFFAQKVKKFDSLTSTLLLITGVLWILLGLRVPVVLIFGGELNFLFRIQLPFYIIAALLGRILTSPFHYSYLTDKQFEFSGYALFFTMIVVVRVFVENYFDNFQHLLF